MRRLLLTSALLLASCREHTLDDGQYAISLVQVLRDDCGLATAAGVLSPLKLTSTGNVVRFDYGFLDIQLVGTYQYGVENTTTDGTAVNVIAPVRGQSCQLDTVSVHLLTQTQSPTAFTGTMSIALDARQPDSCVCKLWFSLAGQHL